MKYVPVTHDQKAFMASIRKKLFVAVAYLLVSAALIVLVSVAQYKIKIVGEINMPQAATVQAQMNLAQSIENHTVDMNQFLVDLLPDDSASQFRTYAQAGNEEQKKTAATHRMDVVIYNRKLETLGEDGTTVLTEAEHSETDMRYKLRIYSKSRLPLEFVLVDHQNGDKDYLSKKIDGVYYFYDYTSEIVDGVEKRTETKEMVFDLSASGDIAHRYSIYVGWDNAGESEAEICALNNMSFRKEVELLELRAEVENTPAGMQALLEEQITEQTIRDATLTRTDTLPAPTVPDGQ